MRSAKSFGANVLATHREACTARDALSRASRASQHDKHVYAVPDFLLCLNIYPGDQPPNEFVLLRNRNSISGYKREMAWRRLGSFSTNEEDDEFLTSKTGRIDRG
jgi:hypothetical protein